MRPGAIQNSGARDVCVARVGCRGGWCIPAGAVCMPAGCRVHSWCTLRPGGAVGAAPATARSEASTRARARRGPSSQSTLRGAGVSAKPNPGGDVCADSEITTISLIARSLHSPPLLSDSPRVFLTKLALKARQRSGSCTRTVYLTVCCSSSSLGGSKHMHAPTSALGSSPADREQDEASLGHLPATSGGP